jgi:thioredoxin 1
MKFLKAYKYFIQICFLTVVLIFNSCINGVTQDASTNLTAIDFAAKIKNLQNAQLVDVRTPEEFKKGHLENAKNIDWNGNDFEKQISLLDKSKPAFVYCLSGGRSAEAAAKMREDGFKLVYELNGGMMKWRSAGMPEVSGNSTDSKGMSQKQFEELMSSEKITLVDFYADWCAPCKKMKPILDGISDELSNSVEVIRINVDDNPVLCKALQIDSLPALQIYKNRVLSWNNIGLLSKQEIMSKLH